ncbi:hypothetical protein IJG76_01775 [Candidatus Saccharibacteria bacterium]|nr:hypothetical protein [Candidatus Saccharibacteria bacterium]
MTSQTLSSKIEKLDTAIEWFYGDEFSLDEATAHYKSALTLAEDIKKELKTLKNNIEVLSEDFTKAV